MNASFDQLEHALRSTGSVAEPAECHGTLCGLLAAGIADVQAQWLALSLDGARTEPGTDDCRTQLLELFAETRVAMNGLALELELLLPGDTRSLATRTDALAHWCEGFLFGLALGRVDTDALSGGAGEAVADFAQVTRACVDEDTDAQESESAFAELVEFVRVGAQLVYEALREASMAQFRSGGGRA